MSSKFFVIMSLIAPKRLFHVPTMSTVLYVDVTDDVKEKGYVAVSHVWGEQKLYSARELNIENGVNWEIPLSDPSKIYRLICGMAKYEMEYCWWDILCMPQDKQDEINLEIPMMGDYYSGADMTFVLSDTEYHIGENFTKWCDMISDIRGSGKFPTKEEDSYILKNGSGLANFSKDPWVKRVWTFQEAALSERIILSSPDGCYMDLTQVYDIVNWIHSFNMGYTSSFADSSALLYVFGTFMKERKLGRLDLVKVLSGTCERNCFKPQDKFYGTLGILGYKDFVVDYDISMDDLNKKMAQYAYSKGDISWIAISGSIGTGFLEPMYKKFNGESDWETIGPLHDFITIENDCLRMKMLEFGEISRCERYNFTDKLDVEEIRRVIRVSMEWGFSSLDVVVATNKFSSKDRKYIGETMIFFDQFVAGTPVVVISRFLTPDNLRKIAPTREAFSYIRGQTLAVLNLTCLNLSADASVHIIEIIGISGNKHLAIVYGNVDIGDKIMVPTMKDNLDRFLGIVVSRSGERKSICYLTPKAVSKECTSEFISMAFPL